jgi:predicted metalloprotease with PDZ domain
VRSGVIDEQDYLDMLAKAMTRHFRGKGHLRQNLAESSFDAWTKFYQQGENAPDAVASYYIKGALAVLLFDLAIRRISDGRSDFDQVMRYLWQHYGKAGVGVPEDGVPEIFQEATGVDLSEMHRRLILDTESIDDLLKDYLSDVGIGFALCAPQSHGDKGGAGETAPQDQLPPPWLGITTKASQQGLEVVQVLEESPAARAGICVGDRLLALGGFRLDEDNLDALSRHLVDQERVSLHAFRDDLMWETRIDLQPGPAKVAYLWPLEKASVQQLERRRQWLQLHD